MNYNGAVWHGDETQCYNYTIEKSLSSTKLVSMSVKATSSLIPYSAQFVVQAEAYLHGTSLVKTPPLASVPGNVCDACSCISFSCIIINKYNIANSSRTYCCHPPFTPVFNHLGCISLFAPKSPISLPLRVYLLSR